MKKNNLDNLFVKAQTDAATAPQLQFSVEDQFKCPLYRAHKPEWVKELNKASDPIIERVRKSWKKKIRDPKDPTKRMPNSLHSELLWQYPEFKLLTELILQQSWNILYWQGYDLKNRIPMMTELWVQEFPEEGGFHDIHAHGNNHVSGFYFLKCNEKTSHPVFHDPRPGKIMMDIPMREPSKINYGSSQIHYKVKPGDFIFFPSYMPHAYVHHEGKEKFRFIHFNLQAVIDPRKSNLENLKGV
mgnify:CR=1 FL=1